MPLFFSGRSLSIMTAVSSWMREGTPGRHEPLLCRHKPPRFAAMQE